MIRKEKKVCRLKFTGPQARLTVRDSPAMNSTVLNLNRWAEPALALAWPMLWQSSLLIAFLFALDFAFRRRVRASVRYALWLVVLLKLVLPPSLALPTGLGWWLRPAAAAPATPHWVPVVVSYGPAPAELPLPPEGGVPAAPPPARLSAGAWGLAGSGAVSLILLAWMLARWRQVAREAKGAVPVPDRLEELLVRARGLSGLRRPARVRLIARPMSPAVCGLFRPVILLPRVLAEQLPPHQLRAVLLHELVHLRRGDLWLSFAQALLQIVYWWHPLLWAANARIRRAREEAVDDAVMVALEDQAEAYAPTLVQVARLALARPPVSLGLVGILESGRFLRQRIERLLDFHPPRKAGLTLASVFSVAAFAALALPMGQAPAPAPKGKAEIGKVESRNLPMGQVPAPAPEPEPSAAEPASAPPPLIVTIDAQGNLLLGAENEPVTPAQLKTNLMAAVALHPDLTLAIRADAAAPWGQLIKALDVVKETNIKNNVLSASVKEMGKLDEAEAKLKEAGHLDPRNQAVDYYLNLIREARSKGALEKGYTAGTTQRTNIVWTGRGRQILVSKLDKIHIDHFPSNKQPLVNIPLSEVVKMIDDLARRGDPTGQGINFIVAPFADPATGLPTAAQGAETVDINTIGVTMSVCHDLRLADLLEIVVKAAHKPIKCSIEDYAVVFSLKGQEPTRLYLRTIKLDPATFERGVRDLLGLPRSGNGAENFVTVLRQFCAGVGVDLSPPKNLFFNDREGTWSVYASEADLDMIERAVQVLNAAPSQPPAPKKPGPPRSAVLLQDGKLLYEMGKLDEAEAKLKEAGRLDPRNQAVDYYLNLIREARSKGALKKGDNSGIIWTTNYASYRIENHAVASSRKGQVLNNVPARLRIQAVFIELPRAEVEEFWEKFGSINGPAPGGSARTATLTHAQAAAQLDRWKSMGGKNILSESQVTTLSGRQAEIMNVDIQSIVIGNSPTSGGIGGAGGTGGGVSSTAITPSIVSLPFGPTLDTVGYVSADGFSIQMILIPSIMEFIGYDDPGPFATILAAASGTGPATPLTAVLPLPHFRIRQVTTSVNVYDGQTVVLGHFTGGGVNKPKGQDPVFGDLPVAWLFGGTEKTDLLILVTPTIVDPAGNPIHPQNK